MTESVRSAVSDTNILISGFLFRDSVPAMALARLQRNCTLLFSVETRAELERVWRRKKFDRYISPDIRKQLLDAFLAPYGVIEVRKNVAACRDPQDDKFLSLAVSGEAELILTGDADLLALHPFRGIRIVSPQAYLATNA